MFGSESSTKRFFNKLRRPFQRPGDYYYFDQQNYKPSFLEDQPASDFYAGNYVNENNYNKISIIPFLQNAGLDINQLNHEVIDVLNKISIDDDISSPKQNKNKHSKENKKKQNRSYMEPPNAFAPESFFTDKDPVLDYKNEILFNPTNFDVSNFQFNDKSPKKLNSTEIYGDFDHFSSDLSWNERKRQLKYKDLAKNDIVSESILKSIDEIIKVNNKQYKQIRGLVTNLEKYLNIKNKVHLTPESEEVIENFIKLFNIKGYNKLTENEMLPYLQNFVFGIYIREGTLKKCHSNFLSAKINGEFATKNNDVDVNFYYEEFQKIQSNLIEDSKNYADYISEEGSLFILNMIANEQQYTTKTQTLQNEIYSNRFEYLYKQYPQEMLGKLFEYSLRYEHINWDIFEKFLKQDSKPKKSMNMFPAENNKESAVINGNESENVSPGKNRKSINRERKLKQATARILLSLDNLDNQPDLFQNRDIVNVTTNNPNSSYLNLDLNKNQQIDDKDSSRLDNQDGLSLYKEGNLETGTAVDPSNKENQTTFMVEKNVETPRKRYSGRVTPNKSEASPMDTIPGSMGNR